MEGTLRALVSKVEVSEPVSVDGLQVFGLKINGQSGLSYTTLDEALGSDALDVTEVDEHGHVPTLRVTNKGDTWVFLMAGEHLIGAKQDRVLNTSMMADRRSQMNVDVSCVEQGRWGYRSHKFHSRGSSSGRFGGPDMYVTVQVVPEGAAPLRVLNRRVAEIRGIELIYCGEGYSSRQKTERSMLGSALARACEIADEINKGERS